MFEKNILDFSEVKKKIKEEKNFLDFDFHMNNSFEAKKLFAIDISNDEKVQKRSRTANASKFKRTLPFA